jgi:2-oxoisovalerate dehydrogenase E2 component (dihydrolipoyl transacylase)
MADLKEFRLPDVGEGLTEADIVRWHVRPGDPVTVNQIIVEIETAKAVVELPSPYAGVVASLLVPEGQTADVGTPIITVNTGHATDPDAPAQPVGEAEDAVSAPPAEGAVEPGIVGSPAPKAERQAVLVGYGVKLGRTTRRPRKSPPAAEQAPSPVAGVETGQRPAAEPVPAAAPNGSAGKALAKPPVRKMARDLGIDLAALTGTGRDGSITRDDVQRAAAVTTATAVPSPGLALARPGADAGREERIPVRGVRKHIAAAMVTSAFTAPHVTEFLQIDITETMTAVGRLRGVPEFEGVRVSPLLLVARALIIAARRHPLINASWDEAAQEIVVRHYVNLGIAAATERGLIVPNVKNAEALGVFGVDSGTPILTPGEAAILAFGQVRDAPWVIDGQLAVRQVCTLSLSFDHRIVDGELGSAVLRDVGAMLTDPLRMLAWS